MCCVFAPAVVAVAAQRIDAESRLERKLGRKPTENEIRTELNLPLVVGQASFEYLRAIDFGGCEVSVEGTNLRVRIHQDAFDGRTLRVTVLDASNVVSRHSKGLPQPKDIAADTAFG